MPYILSLVTFLPLIGALALFVARLTFKSADAAAPAARWIALVTTLVTLAVSVGLVAGFDPANTGYQFVEMVPWFAGASYH
ncbi:MAG: NADH-quinone oxidoreductase subunit M, partial [Caulobacteraceae bacterium]